MLEGGEWVCRYVLKRLSVYVMDDGWMGERCMGGMGVCTIDLLGLLMPI